MERRTNTHSSFFPPYQLQETDFSDSSEEFFFCISLKPSLHFVVCVTSEWRSCDARASCFRRSSRHLLTAWVRRQLYPAIRVPQSGRRRQRHLRPVRWGPAPTLTRKNIRLWITRSWRPASRRRSPWRAPPWRTHPTARSRNCQCRRLAQQAQLLTVCPLSSTGLTLTPEQLAATVVASRRHLSCLVRKINFIT